MHRDILARLEEHANCLRFDFMIPHRNNTQKSLRLRTIVGVVILARVNLNTDVFLERADFRGIKRQLIPARNWWIEVVVKNE